MTVGCLTVYAPATTANLGPGFDTLGLALDLWNEAVFCLEGDGFLIDFKGEHRHGGLPDDSENLIARAFSHFYNKQGKEVPRGVHITCTNRIPTGSGMGSSAAAVLTGLGAANAFLGNPLERDGILEMAAEMEGHPDNAAAALFGGLTVCLNGDRPILTRCFEAAPLPVVVAVPKFHLPTQTARAALPSEVSIKDAVFKIGRAVLVVEALRSGDLDLLGQVMADRLHQPCRFKLIPGCLEAQKRAFNAGAKAVALSGAGPGLLAFARPEDCAKVGAAMQEGFEAAGLKCVWFNLSGSSKGMRVEI